MKPSRASLQAAAADVPFRVHFADGETATVRAPDPETARKAAARPGTTITKIKRDRTDETR